MHLNEKWFNIRHAKINAGIRAAPIANKTFHFLIIGTIRMIVGHSGTQTLTECVYTHLDMQELLDAINLI